MASGWAECGAGLGEVKSGNGAIRVRLSPRDKRKSVTQLVRTDGLGYKSYRMDSVQPFAAASGPEAGTAL